MMRNAANDPADPSASDESVAPVPPCPGCARYDEGRGELHREEDEGGPYYVCAVCSGSFDENEVEADHGE